MAVVSSGTIGLINGIDSVFHRGKSTANYRGTGFWYRANTTAGAQGTFSNTNLNLKQFYGRAPTNEFNTDCNCNCQGDCNCNCGK